MVSQTDKSLTVFVLNVEFHMSEIELINHFNYYMFTSSCTNQKTRFRKQNDRIGRKRQRHWVYLPCMTCAVLLISHWKKKATFCSQFRCISESNKWRKILRMNRLFLRWVASLFRAEDIYTRAHSSWWFSLTAMVDFTDGPRAILFGTI